MGRDEKLTGGATKNDLGGEVGRGTWTAPTECSGPIAEATLGFVRFQYSSASITVRTRVVTAESAGSGDISSTSVS
jgi:hypothetical protein